MRLTLRTLLAYLDDLLDPTETKEIGEKIQESKVASDLVERIHQVMRKRRLTAPELEGPESGMDPNVVAEYLDNQLPAEQVADVEKVFLESDLHLAEVAATQQILTLVLGEPVELSPQACERLYALTIDLPDQLAAEVQQTTSTALEHQQAQTSNEQRSADSKKSEPAKPSTAANQSSAVESTTKSPRSFEEGIPDYLKRKPFISRLIPYGTIAVIAGLWIALLVYDFYVSNQQDKPIIADQTALVAQSNIDENETSSDVVGSQETPEPIDTPVVKPSSVATVSDKGPSESPEPVSVNTAPSVVSVQRSPVIAMIPQPAIKPPVIPPAIPKQAPVLPAATLKYISKSGILLRHETEKKEWHVMPRRSLIEAGEQVASPEPFRSVVEVDGGRSVIQLLGHTKVHVTRPTAETAWGLSINEGRLIITSTADDSTFPKEGLVFQLKTGNLSWRVRMNVPETVCGIKLTRMQPNRVGQKLSVNSFSGHLYVVSGTVDLTDPAGTSRPMIAGDSFDLTRGIGLAQAVFVKPEDKVNPDASSVKKDPAQNSTATSQPLPEWLDDSRKTAISRTRRSAAVRFEKEFDEDLSIRMNLTPLITDRDPRITEYSVKCLALTGNVDSMIEALARTEHKEACIAAIDGLRTWLGSTPGGSEQLSIGLQKVFPQSRQATIQRYLWGFTKSDAQDRDVSNRLIDGLRANHIAMRELAIYHIKRLTGQTNGYRADASQTQREAAIRRWQDFVDKAGALIPK